MKRIRRGTIAAVTVAAMAGGAVGATVLSAASSSAATTSTATSTVGPAGTDPQGIPPYGPDGPGGRPGGTFHPNENTGHEKTESAQREAQESAGKFPTVR